MPAPQTSARRLVELEPNHRPPDGADVLRGQAVPRLDAHAEQSRPDTAVDHSLKGGRDRLRILDERPGARDGAAPMRHGHGRPASKVEAPARWREHDWHTVQLI